MPRELVVGNGRLLVNFDRNLAIRDFFYPHVGLHNHVGGFPCRIGVWVDGQFSWLDETWFTHIGYRDATLTGESVASNGRLGINLRFIDAVHPEHNVLIRRIQIENLHPREREVRLFLNHDFRIYETDIGDTVFFHPFTQSIVHFKRDCYLLINGRTARGGIDEYATGVKGFGGAEGTWRDAEDGILGMHPIEQGSVDSTISFHMHVQAQGTEVVDSWIAVGRFLDEVANLNQRVIDDTTESLLEETNSYWRSWLNKSIEPKIPQISNELVELYERSLLTIQTQIDRCGGILAANDTDIMQTARAHYSYVWPRDAALVAYALDQAGYSEPSRRFFSFCSGILTDANPFFFQKYLPDGTLGATWHPWIVDGQPEIPCQQDSTALVVWAIGKHFDLWKDKNSGLSSYQDIVVPAVDYMINQLDPSTGLPKPSYDLWEQRRGIHLWTCSTVYGALCAALKLATLFDKPILEDYRKARTNLKKAILSQFYNPELGRFVRSLTPRDEPNTFVSDPILDASMAGIFLFDVLPADDPHVVSTMQAVYERLWVRSPIGGLARFEDDRYFQISTDLGNVQGNPWFVTTLWLAEWYIQTATNLRDLEPALDILHWTAKHKSEAGLLAEQLHPYTGQPLSVMPLTWSHATYITTFLNLASKIQAFTATKTKKQEE